MADKNNFPKRVKTVIEEEGNFRVVEITLPDREAPTLGSENLDHIGKSYVRKEAFDKVTGTAKYSGDFRPKGMLYGTLLRSERANAKILEVDWSEALKMPGVLAHVNLKKDRIRFQGEILGSLAAETQEQAEDALKTVKVRYEDLPFVVNMKRAMASNAPLAYTDNNVQNFSNAKKGDVKVGFEQADVTVEEEYITHVEIHNPLEPHSSLVQWDGNKVIAHVSTQTIGITHGSIVGQLKAAFPDKGISESTVSVISEHLGGGFGCKIGPTGFEVLAARMADEAKRPVLIMDDRRSTSLDAGNRPDTIQKMKLGAKTNGEITALDMEGFVSGGVTRGDNITALSTDMYKNPNFNIVTKSIQTNTGGGRACRAPGHVQNAFAVECVVDEMSEKLKIDPLEFRKINYANRSYGDSDNNRSREYTSKALMQCYDKGAEAIGWKNRNKIAGSDTGVIKRGMGVSSLIWGGVGSPNFYVDSELYADGKVVLKTSTQDVGTGTRIILAQVAAEDLGISVDDVEVLLGRTGYPPGSPSYGSLTAPSMCPAARNSVEDALRKLYPTVAAKLNVEPDALEYSNGDIRVKASPNRKMNYLEALKSMPETVVKGNATRGPNPREYSGNTFGAHFVDLEVNTETGKVKIHKYVAAHDSGRIINPMTARNQVMGAVNQSISCSLVERRIMDNRTGRMVNTNLRDYKMIAMTESPDIEVILADNIDNRLNNLGMKGIGEPPRIGVPGAIANAIYNAIGVRIREIPMTPELILNALESKKEKNS